MRAGFFSLTLTVNVDFEGVYAQTYLRFFPRVWGVLRCRSQDDRSSARGRSHLAETGNRARKVSVARDNPRKMVKQKLERREGTIRVLMQILGVFSIMPKFQEGSSET